MSAVHRVLVAISLAIILMFSSLSLPNNVFAQASTCSVSQSNINSTVVISKLKSGSTDEFIEIYNRTGLDISLDGWKLSYFSAANKLGFSIPLNSNLMPRSYALATSTNNPPVGLTGDFSFSGGMAETGGHVAIIDNNLEAMLDMKNQLSYLSQISISIFIMESITGSPKAEDLLENFDLIIVASPHYKEVTSLLPDLKEKVIEVAVSPSQEALIELATLDRNARIGIISRTNVFLITVQETLFSFHFKPENISSFFELEYTVETFFPGGIDALISFSDAHIFTSENFIPRNEALRAKGGKLIRFEYQIERGSLIYIEDKINSLLPGL